MPDGPTRRTLSESEFNEIKQRVLSSLPAGLSEPEFQRAVGPKLEQALAEAEYTPAKTGGSVAGNLISGAAEMLNPVSMVQGAYQAVAHPIDTVSGIARQMGGEYSKGLQAAREGRPTEALARAVTGSVPVLGPVVGQLSEQLGERAGAGDVAGVAETVGKGFGVAAPFLAGKVLQARNAPNPRAADIATRAAEEQVAGRVLAPGNPAYRGRSAAIAPEVLARKLTGGREELRQAAQEGMADAGQRLDDAIQAAGGVQAPIPVDDVLKTLRARVKDLQDSSGQPLSGAAAKRIQALQERMMQLRALGQGSGPPTMKTVSFEDLRKLRDENYRIADEARGYEKQGNPAMSDEGWAARETGSAIRETFAQRSPASAQANADYAFFKTLDDVLDPVIGRPKSAALPVGVTGGSRTIGAVVGNMIGGPKAAFVLSTVVPWVREKMASPAWQLADAQSKLKLAEAMRKGDIGLMKSLMVRIGQAQPAQLTSPNESPLPPTAAPATP